MMNKIFRFVIVVIITCSAFFTVCRQVTPEALAGSTYRLIRSEMIRGADTSYTVVDSNAMEMIKMFNETHFAFFNHNKGGTRDSVQQFTAGGGRYELKDDNYTEHLDYCNYREWEGRSFHFKLRFIQDTLIQEGTEDIPELGIKQQIKEVYIRVNSQ